MHVATRFVCAAQSAEAQESNSDERKRRWIVSTWRPMSGSLALLARAVHTGTVTAHCLIALLSVSTQGGSRLLMPMLGMPACMVDSDAHDTAECGVTHLLLGRSLLLDDLLGDLLGSGLALRRSLLRRNLTLRCCLFGCCLSGRCLFRRSLARCSSFLHSGAMRRRTTAKRESAHSARAHTHTHTHTHTHMMHQSVICSSSFAIPLLHCEASHRLAGWESVCLSVHRALTDLLGRVCFGVRVGCVCSLLHQPLCCVRIHLDFDQRSVQCIDGRRGGRSCCCCCCCGCDSGDEQERDQSGQRQQRQPTATDRHHRHRHDHGSRSGSSTRGETADGGGEDDEKTIREDGDQRGADTQTRQHSAAAAPPPPHKRALFTVGHDGTSDALAHTSHVTDRDRDRTPHCDATADLQKKAPAE